jgi:hypothetical protein
MTPLPTRRHRRVVTGHIDGKAVILGDERRPAYGFKTVPGFEQSYVWAAQGLQEETPAAVDAKIERTALPAPGGVLMQLITFPPQAAQGTAPADPAAIGQEYLARLPDLAETFEPGGTRMHVTHTIDYGIVLEGDLWLELDDGVTVQLSAGDIVVQQATRHGWRNKGDKPATIAILMVGPPAP